MDSLNICIVLPPTAYLGYPAYEPALIYGWLKASLDCQVNVFEMNIILLEELWNKLENKKRLNNDDRLYLLKKLADRLEPDINPGLSNYLTTGKAFTQTTVNHSNEIDSASTVIFPFQEFRVIENYKYFRFLCKCIKEQNPRCQIIFIGSALSKYNFRQLSYIRSLLYDDVVLIPGNDFYTLACTLQVGRRTLWRKKAVGKQGAEYFEPNYSGFTIERYINNRVGTPILSITASTGCTNQCMFCNMWNIAPYRTRPPHSVSNELVLLNRKFGTRLFRFNDNMLPEDDGYLRDLFEPVYKACLGVSWLAAVFPGAEFRDDTLFIMKSSGCYMLWLGIETGSPRLLKKMNKPYDHKKAIRLMKRIKENGIKVGIYLIADFPGETVKDLDMTVAFLKNNQENIDDVCIQTYFVAGGSPLQKKAKDIQRICQIDPVSFYYDSNRNAENYIYKTWQEICELRTNGQIIENKKKHFFIPTINRMPILTEI